MNTFDSFVMGYMALWLILAAGLAYLIFKTRKLEKQLREISSTKDSQ